MRPPPQLSLMLKGNPSQSEQDHDTRLVSADVQVDRQG